MRALLARRGVEASDAEIRRLLDWHPARRTVLCAFAPLDGGAVLVGFGAYELRR